MSERLNDAEITQALSDTLKAELNATLAKIMATIEDPNSLWVQIPSSTQVDYSLAELAELVVTTANTFVAAARFNGIIKAELAKASGAYKKQFREALANDARNSEGREAYASEVASVSWDAYQKVLYISAISDAAESAARIASESARKLLDKASQMHTGESRASWAQDSTH